MRCTFCHVTSNNLPSWICQLLINRFRVTENWHPKLPLPICLLHHPLTTVSITVLHSRISSLLINSHGPSTSPTYNSELHSSVLHSRISISSDQLLWSLYLFTVMSLVHVFSSFSSFLCFFAIPPLAGQFLAQFFHFSLLQFTSSTSCLYLAICFATQSMSFFPPTLSTHL